MKITVIGTGYVGLPTGVGFAELGNDVICLDVDERKINTLKSGKVTIFEDGLEDLFNRTTQNGKLKFSTSFAESIPNADLVILAVGTPPHPITKEADMRYIKAAAEELAKHLSGYTVVAIKSTVPINTGTAVENIIKKTNPTADFDVISLPEFLREGFAVQDFFNPDRIIVGANTERARNIIAELYEPFSEKTQILYVSRQSSETIKYASNAFLAMKIQYINEMADFCETSGADIYEVAKGMGLDTRIGSKFLVPGPGYGGFCFPKDTNAMAYMGKFNGIDLSLIEATIKGNERRKINMAKRILDMVEDIKNPTIAVLGSAFKGGTDDCRESPAIQIIEIMLAHDVKIKLYDPEAMPNTKAILGDLITYCNSAYEAIGGADILAVLTDWQEFKSLELEKIKVLMTRPQIADFRNNFDYHKAKELGFEIKSLGRK
ncbi:MAG: UDP-glucose/GDP-mannose dehydrogenase family protein [Alphaproteobacteria bacterium]|nr:UDP-glucose/GDP-mannose dehydrogenase family protein [Alphaproteobacteria bacterium]